MMLLDAGWAFIIKVRMAKTNTAKKTGQVSGPKNIQSAKAPKIVVGLPKSSKKVWFVVLAVLLVVAGGVVLISYNKHKDDAAAEKAYEADKVRFAALEADMNEAYGAVVGVVGAPVSEDQGKSCSRVALKFEEGTLGCQVYFHAYYAEAPDISRAASLLANEYGFSSQPAPIDDVDGAGSRQYTYTVAGAFTCRLILNGLDVNKPKITLWCYSLVAKPIYTLVQ